MFSRSFLDPSESSLAQAERDPYEEAAIAVQALREIALQRAQALAKRYIDRRVMLQETDGDGFIGIALYVRVRNERRTVNLDWTIGHFKGGAHTGSTSIPKKRGRAEYDLAVLKGKTPRWAYDLVVETELEARVIRDALLRLTEMDEALRVATRRLKQATQNANPGADVEADIDPELEEALA